MRTSLVNADMLPMRTVSSKAVENFRIEGKRRRHSTCHEVRKSPKSPGVYAYPEVGKLLYEKFLANRGNGDVELGFELQVVYISRKHIQCLVAAGFGFQLAGLQPFYRDGVCPCEWGPIGK